MEYVRLVKALKPYTIMMENVPGLVNYDLFKEALEILKEAGYKWIDYKVVNVKNYGVPQSRRRLVLVGSRLGEIKVAKPVEEKKTVRQVIVKLPLPENSKDPIHKIYPVHTPEVQKRIEMTPKNGGSRKDLPKEYSLKCHEAKNVGFNDVYGRLRWDDYSTTITGGCLNPSKGRFLHPEQNRNISAREAAMLQSFSKDYKFPLDIPKTNLALLIGNALPPKFSYIMSDNIKKHLLKYLKK
jgi:DNA (cytosine-5)-methyltransferase 1